MKNKTLFSLFCVLSLSLASCKESLIGSITLLPYLNSSLYYTDENGQTHDIQQNDSLFTVGPYGGYTYSASGNSELPQKVKTVGSKLDGYHFAGWRLSNNGTLKGTLLKDFSQARMPYSKAIYQAVFNKNAKVTIIPTWNGKTIAGVNPITLDTYLTDVLLDSTLSTNVFEPLDKIAKTNASLKDQGFFDKRLFQSADKEEEVKEFEVTREQTTYYVHFNEYPTFTLMNYDGKVYQAKRLISGSDLSSYETVAEEIVSQGEEALNAVFDDWYSDQEFTTAFRFASSKMPTESLTVYPHFLKKVKVILKDYIDEQGQKADKDLGYLGVETKKLDSSKLLVSHKPNATFRFWYYDKDADGIYDAEKGDIKYEISSNPSAWNTIPENIKENQFVLTPYYEDWPRLAFDFTKNPKVVTLSSSLLSTFKETAKDSAIYASFFEPGASISSYLKITPENYQFSEGYYLQFVQYYTLDSKGEHIKANPIDVMPENDLYIQPIIDHYLTFKIFDSNSNLLKTISVSTDGSRFKNGAPVTLVQLGLSGSYKFQLNEAKPIDFPYSFSSDEKNDWIVNLYQV